MKNAHPPKAEASAISERDSITLRNKIAAIVLASYVDLNCREDIVTTRDIADECFRVADFLMDRWDAFLADELFLLFALAALETYRSHFWSALFTTGMLAEECADMAAVMLLVSGDTNGSL